MFNVGDEVTHSTVRGITGVIEEIHFESRQRKVITLYKTLWTRGYDGSTYYVTEYQGALVGPMTFKYDPAQAGDLEDDI